jgi:hypothetical protein
MVVPAAGAEKRDTKGFTGIGLEFLAFAPGIVNIPTT